MNYPPHSFSHINTKTLNNYIYILLQKHLNLNMVVTGRCQFSCAGRSRTSRHQIWRKGINLLWCQRL